MTNLVEEIKTIQRALGVQPDGIFGPRTARAVLQHLSRESAVEAPADEPLLDARTRKTLETLDPKALGAFEDFTVLAKATAASYGCDYVAISGHRTWAQQDALYKQTPRVTNARGGYSNHNFGIAVDYGVFRGKVYLDSINPSLADSVHRACAVHAKKLGLAWGGDWKRFEDLPHYEVHTGLSMGQKRKIYAEKGSVL